MELLGKSILLLTCCAAMSDRQFSYTDGKFSPCKGTRTISSLEAMKAQGLATKIGAKCITSQVVQFISKHKIPVFTFPHFAKVICQGTMVTYAEHAAKDLILNKGTTAETLLVTFKELFRILEAQNWTIVDKKSGKSFRVPTVELRSFGLDRMECVMKVEKNPVKDANWILYGMNYMLRLLMKN